MRAERDRVAKDFRARGQEAAERIRATGYFADVVVEGREGASPGQVIVDVDVERVRLPNGRRVDLEVIRHPGGAAAVCGLVILYSTNEFEFLVLADTGESEVFYDSAITDLRFGDRAIDYDSVELTFDLEPGLLKEGENLVEIGGVTRKISVAMTPEAQVGDYVIVHTGFALSVLDQQEAEETLRLFAEIAALEAKEAMPDAASGAAAEAA